MGNSIGGRGKKAKVMKINGETLKLKTPIKASEVVKDYPGYVLLDAEAVKHFGIRAKPIEPHLDLKPKKIYFLVELPKFPEENDQPNTTRRIRSGIQMSAKDRLECLMLSRRSASDLSLVRPSSAAANLSTGPVRVKMRLPKAKVEKLMEESIDEVEVAEKIINELYMGNSGEIYGPGSGRRPQHGSNILENIKVQHKKRVSFAQEDGEIQLAETSNLQSSNR